MTLTNKQFRVLMDLAMVSDPWPLNDDKDVIDELLHTEARERGFDGWYVVYHEYTPNEVVQ